MPGNKRPNVLHRLTDLNDTGVGRIESMTWDRASKTGRTFLWTCANRAEVQVLKTFLGTRQGRLVPFWIPTWRRDLRLALPIASGDAGLTVENHGYTRFLFGETQARRHVALVSPMGATTLREILETRDEGSTEVLTLDAAAGSAFATQALVCFLVFCRLDTDTPRISYLTDSVAECALPYVELPEETP